MAPNGGTNLAVGDVINALKVLNTGVPMIGGSQSKITIAGQSSGATMVRALLATPSASSLFKSAIIQSDPMVMPSPTYPRTFGLLSFDPGLWVLVARNTTDHAELFQRTVLL